MSTKSKIVLTLVLGAIAAAIVFGLLSFLEARKSLRDAAFDELTAIRTARAAQIENYFESVFDEANVITENPLVASAVRALSEAYHDIGTADEPVDLANAESDLARFYAARILPDITAQLEDGEATFGGYGPKHDAGLYLQDVFIARNPDRRGRRETLSDTGGPTEYERLHADFHPELRFIVDEFAYYDLFLIDHETGDVVYTVRKEADFATNIYDGPYRGSRLGSVVDRVKNDPSQGAVYMSDFEFYIPSAGVPAIFVASGIYEDDALQGILAIQLTINDINAIMTAGGNWAATGLKETGETYIVGDDFLMRTESRFAVEDFDAYLQQLDATGVPDRVAEAIRKSGSAILRQTVNTEATREALRGETATRIISDYRGVDVLSAYMPLRVKGHDFALTAEIDADEAFAPVRDLLAHIAVTAAIFVPLTALLGLFIASRLMRPAFEMQGTAKRFLDGDEKATFQDQGSDEWGQLGATLNTVLDTTRQRQTDAQAARDEVSDMTRTLMPRAIGERFLEGERKVVSAEAGASAAVFFLVPDPTLNDLSDPQRSRDLYEALDDMLDELAGREGVDILNQAGMHYAAFCGLTAPIKNHAERLFRFCVAAQGALDAFNREHGTSILAMIGFETGPLFGALIGNTAMAYEIWGPIIHTAFDMAHAADPGEMVLSAAAEAQIGRKLPTKAVTIDTMGGASLKARRLAGFHDAAVAGSLS